MRKTNYAEIASKYESNKTRLNVPPEKVLGEFLQSKAGSSEPCTVLDLACGTGLWLSAQYEAYTSQDPAFQTQWLGVDASQEMLGVCRGKFGDHLPDNVRLACAPAEDLPLPDQSVDFVALNFAFHHFSDKDKALNELARVMRPAGLLKYLNVAPNHSPDWWIYRFFPQAIELDRARLWEIERIEKGLSDRGYQITRQKLIDPDRHFTAEEMLAEAGLRETSQLVILDDEQYDRGIVKLEQFVRENPGAQVKMGLNLQYFVAELAEGA